MRKLKGFSITLVAIIYLMLSTFDSLAQSVGINNSGTAPNASALLDLSATDKGFLITRVDTTNINTPAFGLMTLAPIDSCLYLFNGIKWVGMGGGGSDCSCNCESTPPSPSSCGTPFTDARDGIEYGTVKIGKQCWMSENLNYKTSSGVSNCYDNDIANCDTYGRLYDWNSAMAGASSSSANPSGVQGVCPSGWHLPSDEEWKELEIAVGMSPADANNALWRGTVANELKATSWGGTNSSGFTALPGGRQYFPILSYNQIGKDGLWWTATEDGAGDAWTRLIKVNEVRIYRSTPPKIDNAYSVRCVKD